MSIKLSERQKLIAFIVENQEKLELPGIPGRIRLWVCSDDALFTYYRIVWNAHARHVPRLQ